MKIAIMQPYFFPYIGYFQLINSVDRFVIYDDVNFIKQGWINRNKILLNNKEYTFTVQLKDASSFRLIKDTQIHEEFYQRWKIKFMKSIEVNYKSAPFFKPVNRILQNVLDSESKYISKLATNSLKAVSNYIGIKTFFIDTSSFYENSHLSGQERILDICKKEQASHYINS
ncbi:MAG TPA: WbqC family protein, partial [Chitinophagaceae bacterium]